MRLRIATPAAIVVDEADVDAVRAEDETGGFGILNGHADFLTVLALCIVSWRRADGGIGYCAVRRGVLTVSAGQTVEIATRGAVASDDLEHLEKIVLNDFRQARDAERAARTRSLQLQMKAIRQIVRYLRAPAPGADGGAP